MLRRPLEITLRATIRMMVNVAGQLQITAGGAIGDQTQSRLQSGNQHRLRVGISGPDSCTERPVRVVGLHADFKGTHSIRKPIPEIGGLHASGPEKSMPDNPERSNREYFAQSPGSHQHFFVRG